VIHRRLTTAVLTTALLASVPGVALAQDEAPTSPESADWSLVRYYDEEGGAFADVPFAVQPTLRLQDGTASGFAGCNDFTGSYELDGSSLTFGEEMSVTLTFCEGPGQLMEDSYLAALGQIGSWSIEGQQLQLYDNLGDPSLTFEVPSILWTPTQVATLQAALGAMEIASAELRSEIETLRADTDALNVSRLRERIKALEAENKTLVKRVDELEDAPTVDPTPAPRTTTSLSAAEKVLLKGIPTRIANFCSPLRSSLPKGTQAAVTCRPNTKVVSSVDYFLLEGERAATQFGSVMSTYNVPETTAGGQSCEDGVKSQSIFIGNGWQAQGCYRENKTAQLRFVDNATDCKKLKVGGRTLSSPAFYIALQGANNDVARVYDWATRNLDPESRQLTSITQYIPSNAAASPSCLT
jgi:heat shock protein HslJ